LGEDTSQDEAGTAAYKTVELDDRQSDPEHSSIPLTIHSIDLHGLPVQYREIQGNESGRFLSYFPRFITMKGGVASGFHHVSAPPALNTHKLYRITLSRDGTKSTLTVREVAPEGPSLVGGDTYVLDKGAHVWQFNTKGSAGQERFKAAEFVQMLVDGRKGKCDITVYGKARPDSYGMTSTDELRRGWAWGRNFPV